MLHVEKNIRTTALFCIRHEQHFFFKWDTRPVIIELNINTHLLIVVHLIIGIPDVTLSGGTLFFSALSTPISSALIIHLPVLPVLLGDIMDSLLANIFICYCLLCPLIRRKASILNLLCIYFEVLASEKIFSPKVMQKL